MPAVRVRIAIAVTAMSAALALTVHGQSAPLPIHIETVGLPAVDEGVIVDSPRTPSLAPARARRAAAITRASRRGAAGRVYVPGKVLVRFRDEVSTNVRREVARAASGTADLAAPRQFADFDVVRIDPSEDAEAV